MNPRGACLEVLKSEGRRAGFEIPDRRVRDFLVPFPA